MRKRNTDRKRLFLRRLIIEFFFFLYCVDFYSSGSFLSFILPVSLVVLVHICCKNGDFSVVVIMPDGCRKGEISATVNRTAIMQQRFMMSFADDAAGET